jgi:hypothetical protein
MREYLVRVRHHGDTYHATIREIVPSAHPESMPFAGPEATGVAATEPAAILAAVTNARLPEHPADRRESRYAC